MVCKGSGYGAIATVNQEKAHIARQFMALKVKKDELDNKFNYYLLNSVVENIKTDARGLIAGIARDAVLKQDITVPILDEQAKIGEFFSNLDNLITLHLRKPCYKVNKRNIAWEQRKLGELTERVQKNDGRMDLPTLTISAGNGWMDQVDRFSGNIAGKEQKNYTLLHKGELSYNHGNSKFAKYGAVFELKDYEEALVPRVYHSFRMLNDNDSAFIEYLFATKIPDRELGKVISSGARMDGLLNIGFDEFMGIPVTVTNTKEQHQIAAYFHNLDNLITLHQRKEKTTLKALIYSKIQLIAVRR